MTVARTDCTLYTVKYFHSTITAITGFSFNNFLKSVKSHTTMNSCTFTINNLQYSGYFIKRLQQENDRFLNGT